MIDLKNTILEDVAAVIGFTATLRLVAWFGDRGNLYIPDKVEEGQLLVRLIGMSAAKKLTQEWGHQHIHVPRLRQYEDDLMKREVGRLFEHNMNSREIASMKRVGERRVQQICRELEIAGLISIVTPKNTAANVVEITGDSAPKNMGGKNFKEKPAADLPLSFFRPAKPKSKGKQ